MALRVLLADDSSTIQKVIELTLQDYFVEVKTVNVGTDVLPIARNFKPDIIFVDVMLPKKNGYQICSELKSDPALAKVPIVLLWSGFVDIDETKLAQCNPEGRLEKPFETEQLRQLVQKLVPDTGNDISSFLEFPDLPDFEESQPTLTPPPKPPAPPKTDPTISLDDDWASMDPQNQTPTIDDLSDLATTEVPMNEMPSLDTMDGLEEISLQSDNNNPNTATIDLSEIPEGMDDDFAKVNLSDLAGDAAPENLAMTDPMEHHPGDEKDFYPEPPAPTAADLEEISLDQSLGDPIDESYEPDLDQNLSEDLLADSTTSMESSEATIDNLSNTDTTDDIDKFRVNLDDLEESSIEINLNEEISDDDFMMSDVDTISAVNPAEPGTPMANPQIAQIPEETLKAAAKEHLMASIDYSKIEEIVREQLKPSIEAAVWKILPEIAERVVRQELEKLLKDVEKDYEGRP